MANTDKSLAEQVAEEILSMISIDKKFLPCDKLPNENELSIQLNVSRTTLREAIHLLTARNILETKRGKGSFVKESFKPNDSLGLEKISTPIMDIKALFEIRLIFEPQVAYFAAKRATDMELERILYYGALVEEKINNNQDRTEIEQAFHNSIAKATHNELMNELIPIIYKAIDKAVLLSNDKPHILVDTLNDHRMIMNFLKNRDCEGAKTAMKLHIIHALREFGIEQD